MRNILKFRPSFTRKTIKVNTDAVNKKLTVVGPNGQKLIIEVPPDGVIAAGPLNKQHATVAYQTILQWDDNQFVVRQKMYGKSGKVHYHNGNYMGNDFGAAYKQWLKRLTTDQNYFEHFDLLDG